MQKYYLIFFLVLLVLIFSCKERVSIVWYDNLDKAIKISKDSKKVLMIDVWTDWCTWCKKLDAETYSDKKIIEESKKFVCLKINPEKDSKGNDFIQPYNITGYPTILFIEQDGSLLSSINGFLDAPNFLEKMKDIYNIKEKIIKYTEEYEKGSYDHSIELINILFKAQRDEKGVEIFFNLEKNGLLDLSDKDTANVYLMVGTYYGGNGDYTKAKEIFSKLIYHNDSNIRYTAIYYYAVSNLLNGDEKLALKILNENISDKNIPEEWKNLYKDLLYKYTNSK